MHPHPSVTAKLFLPCKAVLSETDAELKVHTLTFSLSFGCAMPVFCLESERCAKGWHTSTSQTHMHGRGGAPRVPLLTWGSDAWGGTTKKSDGGAFGHWPCRASLSVFCRAAEQRHHLQPALLFPQLPQGKGCLRSIPLVSSAPHLPTDNVLSPLPT